MSHLRAIKAKLEQTLKVINANLEIYDQRVKEIKENSSIRPEHKQMNIVKFEIHFTSVVGMSMANMKKGQEEIEGLIKVTDEKILKKQANKEK